MIARLLAILPLPIAVSAGDLKLDTNGDPAPLQPALACQLSAELTGKGGLQFTAQSADRLRRDANPVVQYFQSVAIGTGLFDSDEDPAAMIWKGMFAGVRNRFADKKARWPCNLERPALVRADDLEVDVGVRDQASAKAADPAVDGYLVQRVGLIAGTVDLCECMQSIYGALQITSRSVVRLPASLEQKHGGNQLQRVFRSMIDFSNLQSLMRRQAAKVPKLGGRSPTRVEGLLIRKMVLKLHSKPPGSVTTILSEISTIYDACYETVGIWEWNSV